MKPIVCAVLCSWLASCTSIDDPPQLEAIERAPRGTSVGAICKPGRCGTNSPVIGDGLLFDELNLSGPGRTGLRIVSADRYGTPLRLFVRRHFLMAWNDFDGTFYSGPDLVGTTIRFRHDVSGREYELYIANLTNEFTFWTPPLEPVPLYQIQARRIDELPAGSSPEFACGDEALTSEFGLPHNAFVVQGDIYDPVAKTVTEVPDSDPRFNLACGGTAVAKMHLTRHTRAGSIDNDNNLVYRTTVRQRQAMLKMFTADYCGNGRSFTVAGQQLAYADVRTEFEGWSSATELEAVWTADGARCLNTPRRGSSVLTQILDKCGSIPPRCRTLAEEDSDESDESEIVISQLVGAQKAE